MKDELAFCILTAFVLDLFLGDPGWLPHPVRLIGWVAVPAETVFTRLLGRNKFSGVLFTFFIVVGSYCAVWRLMEFAARMDHRLGIAAGIYFLYAAFAARDLDLESTRVWKALQTKDIQKARQNLSRIVGRETTHLNETEITRATVETVAENTIDGILSPLFFAAIGGAPLAMSFKAVNTLDSMVGHRTPRYREFGWASARLDDIANYIPARIGAFLFMLASFFMGLDAEGCWQAVRRDAHKSPSPNAGVPEAAVAGALGVRLGGTNIYQGKELFRPYLGDPHRSLRQKDIGQAIRLMYMTSILMLIFVAGMREFVVRTELWKPLL